MNFEEFLTKDEQAEAQQETTAASAADADAENEYAEIEDSIDVQKAVVESLAADKAIQDERISELDKENAELKAEVTRLKNEVLQLRARCAEQVAALEKVGEILSKNSETPLSNKVSLLDRDTEVPDRFPGETREHVLEVIAEARSAAEADGRLRRAQVLEGVLLANESEGTLAQKRTELEKLFAENANIVSGPVIDVLQTLGISHKNGEEYLLPAEIIKRTY